MVPPPISRVMEIPLLGAGYFARVPPNSSSAVKSQEFRPNSSSAVISQEFPFLQFVDGYIAGDSS